MEIVKILSANLLVHPLVGLFMHNFAIYALRLPLYQHL